MRDWIDYYRIRKVRWDGLWHALYKDGKDNESWDRCSEDDAMQLLKRINRRHARNLPTCLTNP